MSKFEIDNVLLIHSFSHKYQFHRPQSKLNQINRWSSLPKASAWWLLDWWWFSFLDLFKLAPFHLTVTTEGEAYFDIVEIFFLFSFGASQMDSEILDHLLHSSR